MCVCVFFAGLNISLDLVEPIQRHRLELGVAESEIEFKTCSLRRMRAKRMSRASSNELLPAILFISFLVSVFCIVNLCTNEYSIVFCIFFLLLFFLLFLSFLFLSCDLFLLTSCVLVVVVKLSRVECQKIQNSITLDSLIS